MNNRTKENAFLLVLGLAWASITAPLIVLLSTNFYDAYPIMRLALFAQGVIAGYTIGYYRPWELISMQGIRE